MDSNDSATPPDVGVHHLAGTLLGLLSVAAFSGTTVATRVLVRQVNPVTAAAGRELVAAVLAVVALRFSAAPWPSRTEWLHIVAVAFGVVVCWPILMSLAVQRVPAAHATVVIGVLPVLTAVYVAARGRERPSIMFWAASTVGFAAIAGFAFSQRGGAIGTPDLLLLGAVVACAVGYAEGAIAARTLGPVCVLCWALAVAAPAMSGLTVWGLAATGFHPSASGWVAFGYVSVISSFVALITWYRSLSVSSTARVSQLQLLQPALGLVWAAVILGETVTTLMILTSVVIIGAAFAVQRVWLPRPADTKQNAELPQQATFTPESPARHPAALRSPLPAHLRPGPVSKRPPP